MRDHDAPHEYEVLRRPPRDFFSPVAQPVAGTLYVASFIAILCFIGFAAHNLASRDPAYVEPPEQSTYADDYRTSPIVDLTSTSIETLNVAVRIRDRANLRQHLHQHIVAHGGQLVLGNRHAEDPEPVKKETPPDGPAHGSIYHVNAAYLDLVREMDGRPPWDNPTYYADWAEHEAGQPAARLPEPDVYIALNTKYLWFENTRVRYLTIWITAGIVGAVALAIALNTGSAISRERSRIRRGV